MLQTLFSHTLGKGILVRLQECNADDDLRMDFDVPRGIVGCSFCLEGAMHTRIREPHLHADVSSGISGIWFVPGARLSAVIPSGRTRWLDLFIPYERFLGVIEDNIHEICPELLSSLKRNSAAVPFRRTAGMDANTRLTIEQMLACPFEGALKRLFLESKSLDLLLGEICRHALIRRTPGCPCCSNRAKVEKAKALLLENLADPLTIADLAGQLGMSESSLKRAFRDVQGVSIFAFFQAHRLEQARALLARGEMNVTEVAFCVGYSNHSHFSRAFKRQFGVSPKRCLARTWPVSALPASMTETGTNLA
ncbi:MAG TPA: AraC family transcriptional regulator [Solidesulfovibrio sp.]|nr:hypothetical protein [Desulfovibrio sp.]HML59825.1 AraC family transcriptional regulator [Solidesulfovibrio sp.]